MRTVKVYRADDYYRNMGNIIGFFASKEEAESQLEFSEPTNVGDGVSQGTFSLITEFEIPKRRLEGVELVELSDTERMLEEDIWGSGEITNEYYYI